MKSSEGTVVDADDLVPEMTTTAQTISEDLGKLEGYSEEEKAVLFKTIGLGAFKYYMLKVDPKKQMMFNPEESVDFAGNTGPFIQYTYARIQSILRKADFDFENVVISSGVEIKLIASGGISTFDELPKLAELGCEGTIIGKAIYEGRISLKQLENYILNK